MENDQVKLLSDFRIQTDQQLDRNRPELLEKEGRVCFIVMIFIDYSLYLPVVTYYHLF